MSNFTPLVKKEYEFEGDKVWVTFARLHRSDVLSILPLMSSLKKTKEESGQNVEEMTASVMTTMLNLVPKYVRKIEGLKDTAGDDISIQMVTDEIYFISLATQIVTDIMNESIVLDGSVEGKKS